MNDDSSVQLPYQQPYVVYFADHAVVKYLYFDHGRSCKGVANSGRRNDELLAPGVACGLLVVLQEKAGLK